MLVRIVRPQALSRGSCDNKAPRSSGANRRAACGSDEGEVDGYCREITTSHGRKLARPFPSNADSSHRVQKTTLDRRLLRARGDTTAFRTRFDVLLPSSKRLMVRVSRKSRETGYALRATLIRAGERVAPSIVQRRRHDARCQSMQTRECAIKNAMEKRHE